VEALQILIERHTIGEVGQRIVAGEMLRSCLGAPPLGHVLDDVHDVVGISVLAGNVASAY
jgi:hypothetical protein